MTVVIGPNGSGKSNIADAIRWVLGELSSKNIRGTKMEDVIFGGTDTRRPMGYAEVSLTFDNTDGETSLPVEYDEVTVTRKYYRSGESVYMINGQNVRLRDITELFMNTGLGKSGYSIIGQGRISEIISKKSEDRRGIFEEAAGISKYRYKKSEAERKLEKTDDNLSRVTDILSELEGRVGPLEKDAEKAKKYLELYAQKKEIDVGLWLYEIDSIRERSQKLNENFEIAKHELEMADDSLSGLERQTELLFLRMHEIQEKSENARKLSTKLSGDKHAADSEALLLEKDVQHISAEQERLGREINQKDAERQEADAQFHLLTDESEKIKSSAANCDRALEEAQSQIEAVRLKLNALMEQEESASADTECERETLGNLQIELSALEGNKNGGNVRKQELKNRIEDLSENIKKTGERLLNSEQTLQNYKNRIGEIKDRITQYEQELKKLNGEQRNKQSVLDNLTVRQNTVTERIKLLKRMEEHFEGYADSVRYVMGLSSSGELDGICGPVSKLIRVEERYATAIEIALGASLQNIVTENEKAAKEAIEKLKRNGKGRATFYPLSTVSPQKLDIDYKKLSSLSGFMGIASDIIECDDHHRRAIDYLLCRTVICQTLDDATVISRTFGYKFKTVSLDGQVVNAGGSLTGGSVRRDGGILSRGAEVLRLEKEKEKLTAQAEALVCEIRELSKKASSAEQKKDEESAALEIVNVMLSSEDAEHRVLLSRLDGDRDQLRTVEENMEVLNRQIEGYDLHKKDLTEKIHTVEEKIRQLREKSAQFSQDRQSLEEKRAEEIERKNALLLRKGSLEKDLSSTNREIQRTSEKITRLRQEIEDNTAMNTALDKRKIEYRQKKKEQEERSRELLLTLQNLLKTDEELKTESESFERQSEELRTRQKEKTKHREIIFKEYTRLEGAIESIKNEQERYSTKLWDEYELTYAASKELNYPPVTEAMRGDCITRQNKLRNRIRDLGQVNVGAIEEYGEVKERYDFLSQQYTDLTNARTELNGIILGLEKDMKKQFSEVFSAINNNFRVVFAELFGGGTAELSLSDPENILESGIEIAVAPPGKIIKSLSLLSGGEQVFVAIALFFAILRVNPAPFCLLDEIEAALDEVNVARFAAYAKNYSEKTQFIIISHRRGTMEQADTMYGVTMGERGISKILPLHLSDVESQTGLKI